MSENTKTNVEQNKKPDELIVRAQIMNELWDDALTAHTRDGNNALMMALFKALRDMGADNEQIEKKSDWYAAEFIKRAMA
jgi:hypothetical protein